MQNSDILLKIDQEFSALSQEKGMNHAFMEYVADDGVMLRANNVPIVGKESVSKLFQGDDTNFTLTWSPLKADIASSGELGYTYGIYELTTENNVQKGTYVSIWKKNSAGNWKFVLDSGNDGIGTEEIK
jgi:ketosteroid isomerase-like protein